MAQVQALVLRTTWIKSSLKLRHRMLLDPIDGIRNLSILDAEDSSIL
jgi:hypothetical protein